MLRGSRSSAAGARCRAKRIDAESFPLSKSAFAESNCQTQAKETKNRERLIEHDAVIKFFNEVVAIAQQRDLLSKQIEVPSMSILPDLFYHLESLIIWGVVDEIRQNENLAFFLEQPTLARDCDEFGTTFLMVAADAGNKAAIEALCNLGANVNAQSDGGETPLVNAIRMELWQGLNKKIKLETVQLLLRYGGDPNQIGFQGYSPLHWAVIEGDPRIVEILLHHKANVYLRTDDRDPMTAMDILLSGIFRGTVAQREEIAALLTRSACGDN